ncbi:MAG: hypothetical protein K6F77_07000 [Lachnospiraceae bacterium]|nr:hypothetical protein [Lachnospiraceae bacterium]
MRKSILKTVGGAVLALAMAVSSFAAAPQADAAKTYECRLVYMDDASVVTSFMANDKYAATTTVKNAKGTNHYTVTLKRSACCKQGTNTKSPASQKIAYTRVLCIDIVGIVADYKVPSAADKKVKPTKLKYSNVSINKDGKAVKITQSKLDQGWIEDDTKNYRLDILNIWNRSAENYDSSTLTCKTSCVKSLKAFNFTKSLSVSFDFTIK